uniref:Uncharacterized protein n=1 Tax=Ananas comosus var. bracteatus TaxID=296719 RepID=A0A6V7QKN4_ANACO|nr:unnamed protein product [Ananas comosus var. bracteatus]
MCIGWEGSSVDLRILRWCVESGGKFYLVGSGYATISEYLIPYRGKRYQLSQFDGNANAHRHRSPQLSQFDGNADARRHRRTVNTPVPPVETTLTATMLGRQWRASPNRTNRHQRKSIKPDSGVALVGATQPKTGDFGCPKPYSGRPKPPGCTNTPLQFLRPRCAAPLTWFGGTRLPYTRVSTGDIHKVNFRTLFWAPETKIRIGFQFCSVQHSNSGRPKPCSERPKLAKLQFCSFECAKSISASISCRNDSDSVRHSPDVPTSH